jgi:hypothetical protein
LSIETIRQEIKAEIGRLQQVLTLLGAETGHRTTAKVRTADVKQRRKISVAGRKKIAAAQRARWAKIRAAKK